MKIAASPTIDPMNAYICLWLSASRCANALLLAVMLGNLDEERFRIRRKISVKADACCPRRVEAWFFNHQREQ
jgi:hypothetical protein